MNVRLSTVTMVIVSMKTLITSVAAMLGTPESSVMLRSMNVLLFHVYMVEHVETSSMGSIVDVLLAQVGLSVS
jgi:hypothetical protein